ncbi:MAG TPA: hypothetical protein VM347_04495, partial [Nonomuraea sp.]|nr:hypothetical protein [Nonomuraea sp.]
MLDRLRKPSTAAVLLRELLRGLRRMLPRRLPVRKVGRVAGFVAVALIGAWLGLLIGGRETTPVGPVNTHMTTHLSWSGDTEIRV